MTTDTRVTIHKGAAALVAIALLGAGAGAAYLLMRSEAGGHVVESSPPTSAQPSSTAPAAESDSPLADVIVSLSQDAVERAGGQTGRQTVNTATGEIQED